MAAAASSDSPTLSEPVKLLAKQPAEEVGGGEEQQKARPAPKEQETPQP